MGSSSMLMGEQELTKQHACFDADNVKHVSEPLSLHVLEGAVTGTHKVCTDMRIRFSKV